MSDVLVADNVTKTYKTGDEVFSALKGVSLSVAQGDSLAIIGKSGSGKSTLMHILATLDRPTSGELFIEGQPTSGLKGGELGKLRNQTFGFVFQQFFLNPRQTCLENVALPLMIQGVPPKERQAKALAMLEAVGLADKAKQKANNLSGGQKQRLCIARALVAEPSVIFADEPTGNLDTENGQRITDLLFDLHKQRGITLIVVTHDEDLAKLCQHHITLKDGQIVTGGQS